MVLKLVRLLLDPTSPLGISTEGLTQVNARQNTNHTENSASKGNDSRSHSPRTRPRCPCSHPCSWRYPPGGPWPASLPPRDPPTFWGPICSRSRTCRWELELRQSATKEKKPRTKSTHVVGKSGMCHSSDPSVNGVLLMFDASRTDLGGSPSNSSLRTGPDAPVKDVRHRTQDLREHQRDVARVISRIEKVRAPMCHVTCEDHIGGGGG